MLDTTRVYGTHTLARIPKEPGVVYRGWESIKEALCEKHAIDAMEYDVHVIRFRHAPLCMSTNSTFDYIICEAENPPRGWTTKNKFEITFFSSSSPRLPWNLLVQTKLDVKATDTILDVKARFRNKLHPSVDVCFGIRSRFMIWKERPGVQARPLDDGCTLSEHNIKAGDKLYILMDPYARNAQSEFLLDPLDFPWIDSMPIGLPRNYANMFEPIYKRFEYQDYRPMFSSYGDHIERDDAYAKGLTKALREGKIVTLYPMHVAEIDWFRLMFTSGPPESATLRKECFRELMRHVSDFTFVLQARRDFFPNFHSLCSWKETVSEFNVDSSTFYMKVYLGEIRWRRRKSWVLFSSAHKKSYARSGKSPTTLVARALLMQELIRNIASFI